MTKQDPFTAPVTPANTRAPRRRRDPDADTTETAAAAATPPAAAPTTPDTPEQTPAPVVPPSRTSVAQTTDTTTPGGTLGHVLASPTTPADGGQPDTPGSLAVLVGLARMRQVPVDPYSDFVADGTRKLRFVQKTIEQVASLSGRTRQDVETRALLGIEPLPDDVLEANWQAIYGYPRSEYQSTR
jgi:hypothetical protein